MSTFAFPTIPPSLLRRHCFRQRTHTSIFSKHKSPQNTPNRRNVGGRRYRCSGCGSPSPNMKKTCCRIPIFYISTEIDKLSTSGVCQKSGLKWKKTWDHTHKSNTFPTRLTYKSHVFLVYIFGKVIFVLLIDNEKDISNY